MGVLSSCVCFREERGGETERQEKAERKRGMESGGETVGEREERREMKGDEGEKE